MVLAAAFAAGVASALVRAASPGAQSVGTAHEPGAEQALAAKLMFWSCRPGPPASANRATKHCTWRQSVVPTADDTTAATFSVPATTPAASAMSTVLRCCSHPSLGLLSVTEPRAMARAVGVHSTNRNVEPGVVPVLTSDNVWLSTRPVFGVTVSVGPEATGAAPAAGAATTATTGTTSAMRSVAATAIPR